MNARHLLTSLLLLPLLAGAVQPRADVPAAPDVHVSVTAVDGVSAAPALPAAPAATVPGSIDQPPPLRVSVRGGPALVRHEASRRQVRAAALAREFLCYSRALERARLGLPTTAGNPPPAVAA